MMACQKDLRSFEHNCWKMVSTNASKNADYYLKMKPEPATAGIFKVNFYDKFVLYVQVLACTLFS